LSDVFDFFDFVDLFSLCSFFPFLTSFPCKMSDSGSVDDVNVGREDGAITGPWGRLRVKRTDVTGKQPRTSLKVMKKEMGERKEKKEKWYQIKKE
jgi:hypothetical protein